jgi:hypothetical protein
VPIDPITSYIGGHLRWELSCSAFSQPEKRATWQYAVLLALREEEGWTSTVEDFAYDLQHTRGFFACMAESLRKHICGDSALRHNIDAAALVGTEELAHMLMQYVPWMRGAGAPLVIGFAFYMSSGTNAFCEFALFGPSLAELEK